MQKLHSLSCVVMVKCIVAHIKQQIFFIQCSNSTRIMYHYTRNKSCYLHELSGLIAVIEFCRPMLVSKRSYHGGRVIAHR